MVKATRNMKNTSHYKRPAVFPGHTGAVFETLCIIILLYILLFPCPAMATGPKVFNSRSWHVSADSLIYSSPDMLYTASGNAVITDGERRLSADTIRFNSSKMHAYASGHVVFSSGSDRISGDRMEIDMNAGTGTIEKGTIFIEKNHFYIRGDKIEKTGKSTYRIKNASFTACDGPDPAWHITGKTVDIAVEGFGTIRGARFWIKKIPAVYLPILRFPVLSKRQSGFLLPEAAYSSRMGAQLMIPYFLSINRSTDLTLYFDHLQRRGEKGGLEFRYTGGKGTKLRFFADGFSDRHVDDGKNGSSKKWGYTDDNVLRPNSGRYWIRMKTDWNFTENFSAMFDLDVVSDQDYLRDFDTGAIGYDSTKSQFERVFGRDIEESNDPVRENHLNINRRWTSFSFNGDILWYDDVVKRRLLHNDDTLQHVPALSIDATKQPILGSPIFYTLHSDYAYLYEKNGLKAHRAILNPRLYLPIHSIPEMTIEPYVGFYQTAWYIDSGKFSDSYEKHLYHREQYQLGGEISSEFSRIYSGKHGRKLRHVILPKLDYSYSPAVINDKYPQFDDQVPASGENIISLSITNLFILKSVFKKKPDETPVSEYRQIGRFFVSQPYDLSRRNDPNHALLPLYAELELNPSDMLSVRTDGAYNHDENRLDSGNISFMLKDRDSRMLRIDYRYTKNLNNSIYARLSIPIFSRYTAYGDYERNLSDNLDVKTSAGLLYDAQCWALNIIYTHETNNQKIEATIKLTGFKGD